MPIIRPYQAQDSYSALHLYPIKIQIDKIKKTRREVYEELRKGEIRVNVHYIPVHTQPYYLNLGFKKGDFPNAENYYEREISLPLFPGLTYEMQDRVVGALKKALA